MPVIKRIAAILLAVLLLIPMLHTVAEEDITMHIRIDLTAPGKPISPYIYGINQYSNENNCRSVNATAIRQGGNRMPAATRSACWRALRRCRTGRYV